MLKTKHNQTLIWYSFLLPTILALAFFMAYPILEALRLSFFKSNGTIENFVGLRNYKIILTNKTFWNAVYTTIYLSFFKLLISIPLGFVIAYCINELSSFFQTLFKIVYFIPYVTSVVAAGMIFIFVLHPEEGLLNSFIGIFGFEPIQYLAHARSARWGTILLMVWHWLGFVIIIFIANLQTISKDIYEAALIDGAKKIHTFFYITVPLMRNSFIFLLILGTIEGLKTFTEPYILGRGNGSPGGALTTMTAYIYNRGFMGNEFGVASAAAYVQFALIFIITFINIKSSKMKL
ncbi:MAG: carbohydrate ABC transporter permease [Pleomorphochaeta sp.]